MEALCQVILVQSKYDWETKGLGRLPSMDQWVVFTPSASDRVNIPKTPPPNIHHFLNTRDDTALQEYCSRAYACYNLYPTTYFYQTLLQSQILSILDPYAPTKISG